MLRLVVLVVGWVSLLLAVPTAVYRFAPVVVLAGAVLAIPPAVLPHRHTVLMLELGAVVLWLLPGGHQGPTAVGAVALAVLLYVHHAAAALAAATGWDVRTTGSLSRRFSLRTAVTVGAAAAVSVGMLALTSRGHTVLPDGTLLVGLAAAVLAVAVPLRRLRRPTTPVAEPADRPLD